MKLQEIIMRLSAASGPAGFEQPVREAVSELLAPYVDGLEVDAMGNLIAVKKSGVPGARKLLLDAHMDEVGFIITGIEDGFLRFATLGGVDARMLPARDVKILTPEPVFGVIDTMPPHILSAEDMDKTVEADKLFIDVGLSQEAAEERIPLGTPAVFSGGCEALSGAKLCGKSLDDRSCVAVLIQVMEQLAEEKLDFDLYCLISTQEELGLRGAAVGAFSVAPDYAVAVDVTHAHTPDAKKEKTLKMGGGAAIGVGPNMNRNITDALISTAKECEIPYQIEVMPGRSGTNAWAIQTSRSGVSTALVSLPLKYMHSPVEVIDLFDAEAIVKLLVEFITHAGEVL